MFSTSYPSFDERRIYAVRAHRMRSAVVATLIRDMARWVAAAAR